MNYSKRLVSAPEVDNDEDEHEKEIIVENNKIFFYCDVTRRNISKLCQEIHKLESILTRLKTDYSLNELPSIFIHIQSDGGDAFAGLSAFDTIKSCKVPVTCVIDGFIASAATFIFLGGHIRKMRKHSHILIHQIRTEFWGKYTELCDEMKNSENLMQMITTIYKEESNMPSKKIESLLKKELHLIPEECLKWKIVDEIY
jgi:ATP-dependent protease ClpP protease subunit